MLDAGLQDMVRVVAEVPQSGVTEGVLGVGSDDESDEASDEEMEASDEESDDEDEEDAGSEQPRVGSQVCRLTETL